MKTFLSIVTPWAKPLGSGIVQDQVDVKREPIQDFVWDQYASAYRMKRGSEDAFCFDIRSNETIIIPAGFQVKVKTGIYMSMPKHMGCMFRERSGLANKHLYIHGGNIDSDYRGEWLAMLSFEPKGTFEDPAYKYTPSFTINRGDRVAQLFFAHEWADNILWRIYTDVNQLSASSRGTLGFGSSGLGAM